MVKRVIYGEVANENVAALRDVNARELVFLVLLAACVLAMGVYPAPLADVMNPTIQELLRARGDDEAMNTATFSLATAGPGDPRDRAARARLGAARDRSLRRGARQARHLLARASPPLLGSAALSRRRRWGSASAVTFQGMFVADPMSQVLKVATLLAVAVTLVYSRAYLQARELLRGEFLSLALFATLGMMVMISAHHFLTLYLGLELLALSLYAMVALRARLGAGDARRR